MHRLFPEKMEGQKEKKKFDKKAYRTKKYDNKSKLEEWKQKRKVAMQHRYKKLLKKEQSTFSAAEIYKQFESKKESGAADEDKPSKTVKTFPHNKSMNRARQKFEEKKAARAQKQAEFLQRQKEREEALKKYKQKKDMRFKKLNAKNKKGQPLMGGRIELLLEKIQEQMSQ
jgi:hypothetical protein